MPKTGLQTQDYAEKKSNKKRYILYPTVLKLDNGNIVLVDRVEYHRNTKKMTLHYTDDTDEVKKTVDLLSKYYQYMKTYQQTGNQSAMTQAASFLLKLNELFDNFDILKIEQNKQIIIDNFNNETDLETLINQVELDPIIIKSILVLNEKLQIQ
jgi:hypothetical protein